MAYLRLHSDPGFNFTLNRLAQTIPAQEIRGIAAEIDSIESWITKMLAAGEQAEQEGRYAEAARYLQGAEFYMKQDHADKPSVTRIGQRQKQRSLPWGQTAGCPVTRARRRARHVNHTQWL